MLEQMQRLNLDDLEVQTVLLPWQKLGLSYTATGYGNKIPTCQMVRIPGDKRWRRVYYTRWSNAGTCWIRVKGEYVIVS